MKIIVTVHEGKKVVISDTYAHNFLPFAGALICKVLTGLYTLCERLVLSPLKSSPREPLPSDASIIDNNVLRVRIREGLQIIVVFVLCVSAVTGCSSSKELGAMVAVGGQKNELLNESLENFHQHLYWGDIDYAIKYINPDSRAEFRRFANQIRKSERYLDIKVENVTFVPDTESAEVTVAVQYYSSPVYTLKTRYEREMWDFHRYDGGWLLRETTVEHESGSDENNKSFRIRR